jgi:hypothetical protein
MVDQTRLLFQLLCSVLSLFLRSFYTRKLGDTPLQFGILSFDALEFIF